MIRPYICETAIEAGTGVVQGSVENIVRSPDTDGSGDFIGVFAYDPRFERRGAEEPIGITLSGVVKVRAGGNVTAGKWAALKADASGTFVNVSENSGVYRVCGVFLQSGELDEYVEMLVQRGCVSIDKEGE